MKHIREHCAAVRDSRGKPGGPLFERFKYRSVTRETNPGSNPSRDMKDDFNDERRNQNTERPRWSKG